MSPGCTLVIIVLAAGLLSTGIAYGAVTNFSDDVTVTTGRLGIGTSNPTRSLTVDLGNSNNASNELLVRGSGTEAAIGFQNTASGGRYYQFFSTSSASGVGGGRFVIYDLTAGGSEGARLTIDSAGNVGIGTASPSQKLDVNGGMKVAGASTFNSDILVSGGRVAIGSAATAKSLSVDLGNSNNASNELQVKGSGSEATIGFQNTGSGGRYYQFFSTSSASGIGGGKFAIYDLTANGARVVVDSSGNVGIGTADPSARLDVSGNIRLTGNIVSPNDICIGTCS